MFDVGFWELALIAVIALIVLGPERLPGAARTLGTWVGRARRYAQTLKDELEKEAGAGDLRRDLESIRSEVNSVRGEMTRGGRQLRAEVEEGEEAQKSSSRKPEDASGTGETALDSQPERDVESGGGRRMRAETSDADTTPEAPRAGGGEGDGADAANHQADSGETPLAGTDDRRT